MLEQFSIFAKLKASFAKLNFVRIEPQRFCIRLIDLSPIVIRIPKKSSIARDIDRPPGRRTGVFSV